jgi:peptide/nickel transport system substrate-binding protein
MKKEAIAIFIMLALLMPMFAFVIPTSAQEVPQGPWVDEIVFFVEPSEAKGVDMLKAGQMDAYFFPLSDPGLLETVKASPDLWYTRSYGSYNELTFNPVGPEFPATGKLNPFSIPKIREAMNYIVNREYIAEEISGGLAISRYLAITPSFPDYAKLIDTARALELQYSYNFDKAKTIITEEMQKLGAVLTGGKWQYKGEPVTIKCLIRVEDERKEIGDYVSAQLENIGFTIDRMYKTSAEASPIWIRGDPAKGEWHIYTGGWVTTVISRDQADNFDFFYTPRGGLGPLWDAYKPDPEFDYIAERLGRNDFATVEERNALMARALKLSMKDSVRVWLQNRVSPWIARNEVELTADLAGGFYGSWMWPRTFRFKDTVGGTAKIASSMVLNDPWNPVAGSNWIYDQMIIRATYDSALLPDPFTGLYHPNRIKKAEVEVQKGLPVGKTLDWVTLKFVDSIAVPTDAWYGWNATTEQIITTPSETTAKSKVTVYFEDNLFNNKYHDGTEMSLADFIFNFIMTFDRAQTASPVYDPAYVPAYTAFRKDFKGFKIKNADPLVIEYYSDVINLDAEYMAVGAADAFDPEMAFGPAPWHMIAIGWLAEKDNLLAFSPSKAKKLAVDWMSYIAGPSLPILSSKLDEALAAQFIPYEEVLGNNKFYNVTKAEATAKYTALKTWKTARGHFWVGNGPFYLHSVDTVAKSVTIKAFREHPDKADRFAGFAEPKLPEISLTGPSTVIQTLATEFNIGITFKGQPYATDDMDFVKYLIIGPAGDVKGIGSATAVKDGEWKITLSAADTSILPTGSNKIEVVASSKLVSIPSSDSTSFITVSFGDFLSGELGKLRAELEATITTQGTEITDLTQQITDMQGLVSTLNTTVTVSMAVAVIAIIIAIVIAMIPRLRKK